MTAERFANQTTQWLDKGAITKITAYYSSSRKCVQGLKMTYGAWEGTCKAWVEQACGLMRPCMPVKQDAGG